MSEQWPPPGSATEWDPSKPPPSSGPTPTYENLGGAGAETGGPPPPPPPPPPGYGAPPAGYGAPPGYGPPPGYAPYGYAPYGQPVKQTESKAVVALVLSIVSWVACPFVPAIAALIVAADADRKIKASGGYLEGEGLVKASRIISWIHLGLCALALVIFLIAVVAVGSSGEA